MTDYEQLGVFYLGRETAAQKAPALPVLYDSSDLTTHALIVGMTGSGKTGLGMALLEEALIDKVPVIAIDPKGDLTNLALTFPQLRPADFQPWIDPSAAATAGRTVEEEAAQTAKVWRQGLADWDQPPERIARLKEAAEVVLYTPGSSAGRPVSLLRSLDPPPAAVADDLDLFSERLQTTAQGLLTLVGVEGDPMTSREHLLVANILEAVWREGRSLDLAGLIAQIHNPPFTRLGVMELDAFFPAQERFALAMRLNTLLASPGFAAWLEGDPLDVQKLLYTPEGRPKASVFTLSHLPDDQRMFFVSLLLNQVLAWTRAQPGTGSLRALIYMDEIMGYFPPVANPPAKRPLLTLLKQARAHGVGLVLATQNPVDLDYKGLANIGTWFVGRLQTERDLERIMTGLTGLGDDAADPAQLRATIAGLGKRVFYLRNVHENRPLTMNVRWVLSYLAGPLTRDQIRRLAPAPPTAPAPAAPGGTAGADDGLQATAPVLPPGIAVRYLPASGAGRVVYLPAALARVEMRFVSAKQGLDEERSLTLAAPLEPGDQGPDWSGALEPELTPDDLAAQPLPDAGFAELPPAAARAKSYTAWSREVLRWARQERPLVLWSAPAQKLASLPGEDQAAFRVRVALAAREERDRAVAQLRQRYQSKIDVLERRLLRAQQALEKESEQAQASQWQTAIDVGTTLLGALLGRKTISRTTVSGAGRTVRSLGRARREKMDVERAKEIVAHTEAELGELEERLAQEIAGIEAQLDPAALELKEVAVRAKAADVSLDLFCLAWLPYRRGPGGGLEPDWR